MKRLLIITASLFLCSVGTRAQSEDDFGTWVEIGAEKQFLRPFSLGADLELRTENNSQKVDRMSIGVSAGYKVNKYLKFGLSYNFLEGYSSDKWQRKDGFRDPEKGKDDPTRDWYTDWYPIDRNEAAGGKLNDNHRRVQTRYTDSYWKPRHRFSFDAATGVKLWKRVRISLRERYQYTFHAQQEVGREYYMYKWATDSQTGESYWHGELNEDKNEEKGPKIEEKSHTHVLRSRLKVEWDKKHCKWSPFVSVEAQNELNQKMDLRKIRTAAGTGYKINRHHSVSAAYVFTNETEGPTERMHAINIGYNYKF